MVDCIIYHQQGRLILHLTNLTSAGTWRQPVDEFIPIGPVKVGIRLMKDIQGRNLNLLVSGNKIQSVQDNGWIHFTINSILDHEVVVIT